MRKIRLDKRIRYEGHGDSWPDGPPNYFQKLFAKYTNQEASHPEWLQRSFPDIEVQQKLVNHREEALFDLLEAAKLKVRTTTGWHGRQTRSKQRALGGKLTCLRDQPGKETQVVAVKLELRTLRERRIRTTHLIKSHLDDARYHWHTAMFTVTEYLKTSGRLFLPVHVKRGLCDWLSFPELGIRCTVDTITAAKRHFSIDRRNGRSYPVYQPQLPRHVKRSEHSAAEGAGPLQEHAARIYLCHLCQRSFSDKEIGPHLIQEDRVPEEVIGGDTTQAELYRTDTDETLASWGEGLDPVQKRLISFGLHSENFQCPK